MRSSANTAIIFATAPGKTASDNQLGRNGLFMQEFLKYINDELSIDRIFKLTGKSVSEISNYRQTLGFPLLCMMMYILKSNSK